MHSSVQRRCVVARPGAVARIHTSQDVLGYRVFGPIFANSHGANGADVRGSYGLTMLRRAQFFILAGRVLPLWKGGERGVPSAHPHPAVGAAMQVIATRRRNRSRGRDLGPPGGECLRALSSARRRSPDMEQAGRLRPARRRDGGERAGVCRRRGFRGYRSGVVGRVGPGGADAWLPRRPAVRRAAAGRGLRARPVRERATSW